MTLQFEAKTSTLRPSQEDRTHVQCAEKTPKKNAQAQVQEAAPASKV
jgi:hypothetical protein